jgi:hypothetical protein
MNTQNVCECTYCGYIVTEPVHPCVVCGNPEFRVVDEVEVKE